MSPRRVGPVEAFLDRYRWPLVAVTLIAVAVIGVLLLTQSTDNYSSESDTPIILGTTTVAPTSVSTRPLDPATNSADGAASGADDAFSPAAWLTGDLDINSLYTKTLNPDGTSARPVPDDADTVTPIPASPPSWAASTKVNGSGYLSTDVGCADSNSGIDIDRFLAGRVGPVLGWDYQHVYPLADGKYLWLFQDAFIDHSGTVDTLSKAKFVHNAAMVQTGACFQLLTHGSASNPQPFEVGDGTGNIRSRWWWPMGGEIVNDQLHVFWVEMEKDPVDPAPPDGLGWHPVRTYLATYDGKTLARTAFSLATDAGVDPIFGYAVDSDATHTYLFGNSFEQNMTREGGFWNGPHSGVHMWLARVPLGQMRAPLEYHTPTGWSQTRSDAAPIVSRFFAENPMQPRYINGQWVSATAVDGYWGDDIAIDVANQPWGPWTTATYGRLSPRGNDPLMNTYHAHVLPYLDTNGSLLIAVSNNARDMVRDAYPKPSRYRPQLFAAGFTRPPAQPPENTVVATSTTTTTIPATTTTTTTTTTTVLATSTTTTIPAATTTTVLAATTTTTVPATSTTTTTLVAPTTAAATTTLAPSPTP